MGSKDTTLSMQCCQGFRPVRFLRVCVAGRGDNSFTVAMSESKKVQWNFPEMTGKPFLSEVPRWGPPGRREGRV